MGPPPLNKFSSNHNSCVVGPCSECRSCVDYMFCVRGYTLDVVCVVCMCCSQVLYTVIYIFSLVGSHAQVTLHQELSICMA